MASITNENFFAVWIRRLVKRYTTYIKKKGDHFEKWYNLLLSQVVVHEDNNKLSLLLTMLCTRNFITRCLRDIDLIDCKSVAGERILCVVYNVWKVNRSSVMCRGVLEYSRQFKSKEKKNESFRSVTSYGHALSYCHFSVDHVLIAVLLQVSTEFLFLSFLSEVNIVTILCVLYPYMNRILSFLYF
jgi:hypothetical protein